ATDTEQQWRLFHVVWLTNYPRRDRIRHSFVWQGVQTFGWPMWSRTVAALGAWPIGTGAADGHTRRVAARGCAGRIMVGTAGRETTPQVHPIRAGEGAHHRDALAGQVARLEAAVVDPGLTSADVVSGHHGYGPTLPHRRADMRKLSP